MDSPWMSSWKTRTYSAGSGWTLEGDGEDAVILSTLVSGRCTVQICYCKECAKNPSEWVLQILQESGLLDSRP